MLARPDPPCSPEGALALCLRDLMTVPCGEAMAADLGKGRTLLLAPSAADRDAAAVRMAGRATVVSRSSTSACHAAAWARGGRIGLDVETVSRVALNANVDDPWLADSERHSVIAAADPVIELACRWVLREAYGKALGVGLALPLDRLVFHGRGGRIVLKTPWPSDGWDFALYRRGETLCAVAHHAMPTAPWGRNPPGPVAER
ncbi:4'-phosphopantetheinyl transferase superfamily protein [Sphingomonas paucimobilis]|uniref:4'-phosphopantetheinyl transferase superfamily protein n=1 Tax=Sphingomonas paucimobilis TaxID=13689 RepID=UPI0028D1C4BB|nr:4'-phosphopantetheinyl transferase superfamily protein [Sphingomonas paucimobilis]